jgi:hypothetical protein
MGVVVRSSAWLEGMHEKILVLGFGLLLVSAS